MYNYNLLSAAGAGYREARVLVLFYTCINLGVCLQ
jgi:hypothetical protein